MEFDNRKIILTALLCLFVGGTGYAGDLGGRINAIINNDSQKGVEFGVSVMEADTGRVVYSSNPNKPLIPASNMKMIVTAAAVRYLGQEFVYKTQLCLAGEDLVIIGSGDPLLGDQAADTVYGRGRGWILEDIVAALREKGLVKVRDIIVDSTIFDDQRVHPNWPKNQINRWYASEVCGINYNDNCIDVTVQNSGGRILLTIDPESSFIKVTNNIQPINTGNSGVGSYRTERVNEIVFHGKCKDRDGPFSVAIERPAAFFGFLVAEHLNKAGIATQGRLIEKAVEPRSGLTVLREYRTTLQDCLARANKNSLQLSAEALFKTISAAGVGGSPKGSWEDGRELITKYLIEIGVDRNEFYIDDGSGLSKENRLSANAITRVLYDLYKSKNWDFYKKSLAVGGVDGTIEKFFSEPKYKGKILGKTGFIDGVKSFSGVCETESGSYLFSILSNKPKGTTRTAINNIAQAVMDWGREKSGKESTPR